MISHSIREQLETLRREVLETGGEGLASLKKSTRALIESVQKQSTNILAGQRVITEQNYLRDINSNFLEGDNLAYWEPRIEVLDPEDLEKIEKLENRKLR